MSPLLDTLLPFLFLILLGLIYRLRPAEGFPAEQVRKTIAALALQILFPCMAFRIMSEAPWDWNLIRVPTIAFFCTLGGVLAFALFRKAAEVFTNTSLRPSTWTALALASGWGNVTYLGIPLITAQFPGAAEEGTRVALLFDLFSGSPSLFFFSALASVLWIKKPTPSSLSIRHAATEALRSLVRLRPLWAAFAGLLWGALSRHLEVPTPETLTATLKLASSALPPLMIFAIGLALPRPKLSHFPRVLPSVAIKLLGLPLLAHTLSLALEVDSLTAPLITFEAALPTMALTLVLSDRYGFDTETLAQAIVLSTLSLPFSLSLLTGLGLI